MGIRYQKRVNLGDGFGLNLSKSGISSSYRTKYGSVGPKGFSIRTGIPGLSFRSSFGKSKKAEGAVATIVALLFVGAFIVAIVVIWNVALFLKWLTVETYKLVLRERRKYLIKKEIELHKDSDQVTFVNLSIDNFPLESHKSSTLLADILVDNGSEIEKGDRVAILKFGEREIALTSDNVGKITFYKTIGEKLKIGECIYKIDNKNYA